MRLLYTHTYMYNLMKAYRPKCNTCMTAFEFSNLWISVSNFDLNFDFEFDFEFWIQVVCGVAPSALLGSVCDYINRHFVT